MNLLSKFNVYVETVGHTWSNVRVFSDSYPKVQSEQFCQLQGLYQTHIGDVKGSPFEATEEKPLEPKILESSVESRLTNAFRLRISGHPLHAPIHNVLCILESYEQSRYEKNVGGGWVFHRRDPRGILILAIADAFQALYDETITVTTQKTLSRWIAFLNDAKAAAALGRGDSPLFDEADGLYSLLSNVVDAALSLQSLVEAKRAEQMLSGTIGSIYASGRVVMDQLIVLLPRLCSDVFVPVGSVYSLHTSELSGDVIRWAAPEKYLLFGIAYSPSVMALMNISGDPKPGMLNSTPPADSFSEKCDVFDVREVEKMRKTLHPLMRKLPTLAELLLACKEARFAIGSFGEITILGSPVAKILEFVVKSLSSLLSEMLHATDEVVAYHNSVSNKLNSHTNASSEEKSWLSQFEITRSLKRLMDQSLEKIETYKLETLCHLGRDVSTLENQAGQRLKLLMKNLKKIYSTENNAWLPNRSEILQLIHKSNDNVGIGAAAIQARQRDASLFLNSKSGLDVDEVALPEDSQHLAVSEDALKLASLTVSKNELIVNVIWFGKNTPPVRLTAPLPPSLSLPQISRFDWLDSIHLLVFTSTNVFVWNSSSGNLQIELCCNLLSITPSGVHVCISPLSKQSPYKLVPAQASVEGFPNLVISFPGRPVGFAVASTGSAALTLSKSDKGRSNPNAVILSIFVENQGNFKPETFQLTSTGSNCIADFANNDENIVAIVDALTVVIFSFSTTVGARVARVVTLATIVATPNTAIQWKLCIRAGKAHLVGPSTVVAVDASGRVSYAKYEVEKDVAVVATGVTCRGLVWGAHCVGKKAAVRSMTYSIVDQSAVGTAQLLDKTVTECDYI